ncbi:CsbD family protein [Streptomyces sp. PTM05]|uniref:CsbD family protein n=1 Tax=Streptantibioticus parmotrematis TaxID=2873249 RepID=A0ABS7QXL2_9ACTN|nr:CsbD family protein [Streptantibioticus parmotrematis]MBY8887100.1 CsbD family protein [Streptantibioticus parmotrematis]
MSAEQKAKAKAEQATGAVKKTVGKTVGNESMRAEGEAEQTKGDARAAKEKGKDALRP